MVFTLPEFNSLTETVLFWSFVSALIIIIVSNLLDKSSKQEHAVENAVDPSETDDDNFHEDPELIDSIKNVSSTDELMEIVDSLYDSDQQVFGEGNNALLSKALSFGAELDQFDWADIYWVSEEDSMLEKVATEKAGKVLEEEF